MAEGGNRRRRWRDLALCTLAGTLTFLSFPTALAPDVTFFPLIWLSHVPLLWVLKDKAPRAAFGWGFFTGMVINTGGYYWIASLLKIFGGLPDWVAVLGLLLHSAWLAVMWGLWAWILNRITNTTRLGIEWSAPLVMVAVEFAFPRIFPAYMGNSQYLFPPVMQIVDLFGITAVTFLVYRVNATLYLWVRALKEDRPRPHRVTIATAVMVAGALIYGGVRIAQLDARVAAAEKLKIGLVEGDVGIFLTETRERRENHLLINQHLSAKAEAEGAELIIWSESAFRARQLLRSATRFTPSQRPLVASAAEDRANNTPIEDRLTPIRGFHTPLIFGSTSVEPDTEPRWKGDHNYLPRNTAWLLDADGNVAGAYDKVFLLAFGEYVPFAKYIPWIYDVIKAAGSLEPGTKLNLIEADLWGKGPIKFGMLVCYEGILPEFTRKIGGQRPHLLVNITNDDWFGKTAERYLHFALTVPRAIEHRVAFVRGTLTGVSAFVDPVGRIEAQTSPSDPETLVRAVPLLQSVTVYQLIGDAFAWLCLVLTLGFYVQGRWRRR
ncbi:MAG: apolipoprotein N-acyltransferase [Myxococcales bacterium]|nr:apolipoprotein N-acyltransferase [Myxococcales bacterium]